MSFSESYIMYDVEMLHCTVTCTNMYSNLFNFESYSDGIHNEVFFFIARDCTNGRDGNEYILFVHIYLIGTYCL